MTCIGHLQTFDTNGQRQLRGHIATLELDLDIWLEPEERRSSASSPHFRILTQNPAGTTVQFEAAWRIDLKGSRQGEEMLSIQLDDPSFPATMNVAAFKTERPGNWIITWRRRQEGQSNG